MTLAYKSALARATLQEQELTRMRETCAELVGRIEKLEGPRAEAVQNRVAKMKEAQKEMGARLERVLGVLTRKASPELSESETKWFEELGRMKEEVVGAGRYDETSLVARTKLVRDAFLLRLTSPLKTGAFFSYDKKSTEYSRAS